ncbi:flagellar hook-associated family protein [Rhizobiaceae bacterium n13]|uniref:Flagellin n=1 Tax=Ferirhizobium litorale TaxID=2927786 RepID=A0AAE3U3T8_9HYPH|nr:flagellar hook-associated family protein [Fererhizobium litorale]MDI7863419.1 flagellar hook-associated family protein [Fererhizobium litorale]MDI7922304.1 flagellar hook-associated family protein [Fererhizobium litorale]
MKTSFVSNLTLQNSMRLTIARAQTEVLKLREESVTGRFSDVGVALGVKTSRSLNLQGDLARMESLISTNALTTQRLSASQGALTLMSDAANKANEALIALSGSEGASELDVAKQTFADAISIFTAAANTSFAGEYLFAGINTDVMPFNDYLAEPASPAKAAFDTAFADFMTTNGYATPADIPAAAMQTFISDLEASFMGAGWDDWSNASDQNMTSRISNTEVVQSSTNANAEGMRKFALGAVIGYELLSLGLSDETRKTVSDSALAYIGEGITGVDAERTTLGISQARVKQANTSLEAQKTILTTGIRDLESVDTYEAATRLNTLETQLSLAYTLTSKLQSMSLLNYL